jgi:hypothetical protein
MAMSEEDQRRMLDQLDQMEQLDQLEFDELSDDAYMCIRRRDFGCAELKLSDASKYADSSSDRERLSSLREKLSLERQAVERERIAEERAARERQRAEEDAEEEVSSAAMFAGMLNAFSEGWSAAEARNQQMRAAYAEAIARGATAGEAEQRRREDAEKKERQQKTQKQVAITTANAPARESALGQPRIAQQEGEAKQREERRQEAQAQRERAQEQERLRQEGARRAREQEAKDVAQHAYLSEMRQGIRLAATKCPGGEGQHYVIGTKPSMKQEVSCIDVYYRASCPGTWSTNGVANIFVGASGCFGDTYQIEPKPVCAVEQVRVVVTDVRPCD